MSENQKKKLPSGKYKVLIDSELKKGNLQISHAILNGNSKKEIFLVVMFVILQWQIMNFLVQSY